MSNNRKQQAFSTPPQVQRPQPPSKAQENGAIGAVLLVGWFFIFIILMLVASSPGAANITQFGACLVGAIGPGIIIIAAKFFIAANRAGAAHRMVTEPEQRMQAQETYLAKKAEQSVQEAPETAVNGVHGVLGAAIMGSLTWCKGPWSLLPERELSQHGVLIGASGSGKTITLLRIAYLAAKHYNYKVFFIDAKPSRKTAAKFLTLMKQSGIQTAMFPRMQYNGWRGDGNAILNRLMSIELFTEPYYKATAKRILNAICKPNPPANSTDFLRRLDTLDLATVPGITARDLGGVQNRYHGFFDTLEGQLDGSWSFDTTDAGYLLLDGTALKEEAAALGRYLVEDFGHYCTTRKPPQHKVLLIIDEYSALSQSGADTANLFERIRESGGAILVSGQSYASMGEDIERMLGAANFYIVHRSAAPEQITEKAGTIKEIAEMYQFGGNLNDQMNDAGRVQLEEQPAVHPNKARRLATGEAIIISHGHYMMTRIAMHPPIDQNLLAQAQAWINQPPASPQQPTPAPTAQQQTPQKPQISQHPPELL